MGERENPTVARLRPFSSTIFHEMTTLAVRTGAVNLGQGFPDSDGPKGMLDVARSAIADGLNQYPPGPGMPVLRKAIAAERARFGIDYDPDGEVLVTVGATEAIAAAILGLVEPGREVILLEPFYDSYAAAVAMAGATRRPVPLAFDGSRYSLDARAIEAAVTDRTAMIVVNSPHNPTGTVFSRSDLEAIADIAQRHDLLVLTDEVYEHLVFDDVSHIPIATLPGMAGRTVTVSSAAKTFNVTGWKIGWACSTPPLIDAVRTAKQYLTFVGGAPFQPAVAHALTDEQAWIGGLRRSLQRRRDLLGEGLDQIGLRPAHSHSTYFICADISTLTDMDAYEFCRMLPERFGVAAVPVSALADDRSRWRSQVRFAFCKAEDVLAEAISRLQPLRDGL